MDDTRNIAHIVQYDGTETEVKIFDSQTKTLTPDGMRMLAGGIYRLIRVMNSMQRDIPAVKEIMDNLFELLGDWSKDVAKGVTCTNPEPKPMTEPPIKPKEPEPEPERIERSGYMQVLKGDLNNQFKTTIIPEKNSNGIDGYLIIDGDVYVDLIVDGNVEVGGTVYSNITANGEIKANSVAISGNIYPNKDIKGWYDILINDGIMHILSDLTKDSASDSMFTMQKVECYGDNGHIDLKKNLSIITNDTVAFLNGTHVNVEPGTKLKFVSVNKDGIGLFNHGYFKLNVNAEMDCNGKKRGIDNEAKATFITGGSLLSSGECGFYNEGGVNIQGGKTSFIGHKDGIQNMGYLSYFRIGDGTQVSTVGNAYGLNNGAYNDMNKHGVFHICDMGTLNVVGGLRNTPNKQTETVKELHVTNEDCLWVDGTMYVIGMTPVQMGEYYSSYVSGRGKIYINDTLNYSGERHTIRTNDPFEENNNPRDIISRTSLDPRTFTVEGDIHEDLTVDGNLIVLGTVCSNVKASGKIAYGDLDECCGSVEEGVLLDEYDIVMGNDRVTFKDIKKAAKLLADHKQCEEQEESELEKWLSNPDKRYNP